MNLSRYFIFIFFYLCLAHIVYSEELKINSDGNYTIVENFKLSGDSKSLYDISGILVYESKDSSESFIELGINPKDIEGKTLQDSEEFIPSFISEKTGFLILDSLSFSGNSTYLIQKRVSVGGDGVCRISLVLGATLSKDCSLRIKDFKIVEVGGAQDSGENGASVSKPLGVGLENLDSLKVNNLAETKSMLSGLKDETPERNKKGTLARSNRYIFVNADIGSDNFAGLRRDRGQADGPKRTIKSALRSVEGGDEIVLQESENVYEVDKVLNLNFEKNLIIRADGKVTLKAKK